MYLFSKISDTAEVFVDSRDYSIQIESAKDYEFSISKYNFLTDNFNIICAKCRKDLRKEQAFKEVRGISKSSGQICFLPICIACSCAVEIIPDFSFAQDCIDQKIKLVRPNGRLK